MMTTIYGLASLLTQVRESTQPVQLLGASESFKILSTLACLESGGELACKRFIVVLPSAKEMHAWHEVLASFFADKSVYGSCALGLYPGFSLWGSDGHSNSASLQKQRLHALALLSHFPGSVLIVTTLAALAQRCLDPASLRAYTLTLKVGMELPQDDLLTQLEAAGYQRSHVLEEAGAYALRGGVIDVFAVDSCEPVRLEFFGDTLASVRSFSQHTQRSMAALQQITISPAQELLLPEQDLARYTQTLHSYLLAQGCADHQREAMTAALRAGQRFSRLDLFAPLFLQQGEQEGGQAKSCLLDYLEADSFWLYPASYEACWQQWQSFQEQLEQSFEQDREAKRPSLAPAGHFLAEQELSARLAVWPRRLECSSPFAKEGYRVLHFGEQSPDFIKASTVAKEWGQWQELWAEVQAEQGRVVLLAHEAYELQGLESLCSGAGYQVSVNPKQGLYQSFHKKPTHKKPTDSLSNAFITLRRGDLPAPYWDDEAQVLVVAKHSLIRAKKKKASATAHKLQNYLSSFQDLRPEDLVVHVQHGIGRYLGLKTLQLGTFNGEFLHLEYHGGDKIYVPADRLALLQRYVGGQENGKGPALDKLQGLGWEKRKHKVAQQVEVVAAELLQAHALRKLARSHSYEPANALYEQFVADFPYEETPDQLRAIEEVEADLDGPSPMERIVVGDVGFGKTEVALRAAMRAVISGYQVFVLVPTTVLCFQHEMTFRSRLSRYGVLVASLSRFTPPKQYKETVAAMSRGSLDIIIGTHRLLASEVKPKKLGLIIIDEEQRFGVRQKEKLKQLKAQADILLLTATPIPRTLHMAIVGLRDMSLIATAPHNRHAVKTMVTPFDAELLKEAIRFEAGRGGQVFYVYNRVEDCEAMCHYVQSLVPHVEVRFAHGQMPKQQLEGLLLDFIEQKFSVLLCTTIIESGIDMPNVNTLIVTQSERFGLAQLYQLRGRVGRSDLQAYAYFFTGTRVLSDEASRRLEILQAHQELGAGFHIASADLEIRGAGNLLGGEQAGHVSAVGFELYTQMLNQTLQKLAGKESTEPLDPEIKLPLKAHLPASYMPAESERLRYYKRLFAVEEAEEIDEIAELVSECYGALPLEAEQLFEVARIKLLLKKIRAVKFHVQGFLCLIQFGKLGEERLAKLLALHGQKSEAHTDQTYQLRADYSLSFSVSQKLAENCGLVASCLQSLKKIADSLSVEAD